MNRKEAQKLLSKYFPSRWGKGDHLLFFKDDRLIYRLSVSSRSNGRELPKSEVRKINQIIQNKISHEPVQFCTVSTRRRRRDRWQHNPLQAIEVEPPAFKPIVGDQLSLLETTTDAA